ncbi:MAG: hypothetical protein HXX16_03705 [Bacteroidales bacterium]|nr:hypothetical protein [Bacteroidales bacterium]
MRTLLNNSKIKLENLLCPNALLKINTSIAENKGRLWCAYRTRRIQELDTAHYITELNKDIEPINHTKLDATNENPVFEDVRLFSFQDNLLAFYTYLAGSPEMGWLWMCAVGMGIIDTQTGRITQQQSFRCYGKRIHEKNWTPVEWNERLFIITDFAPRIRILEAMGKPGNFILSECYNAKIETKSWSFGEIRGGTPFVSFPKQKSDWRYGFVHSVIYDYSKPKLFRTYYYTIARINLSDFTFQYYPDPIGIWEEENTEEYTRLSKLGSNENYNMKCVFPMGLVNYDEGVLLSYGKDDCVSRLKYFSWDFLLSLFSAGNNN